MPPPLRLPPRSRLYHLEPVGVGTGHVEGLASYIVRLAEAHHVSTRTLLVNELAPLVIVKHKYNDPAKRVSQLCQQWRATGDVTAILSEWVGAAAKLTLREDLHLLTMLRWASVLDLGDLYRPLRAWCARCYEEWRAMGQVIYEPLIWNLQAVEICPWHLQRLRHQCHQCVHPLDVMTRDSRPGHCSRCGQWLGRKKSNWSVENQRLTPEELKWEAWVVSNAEELVAAVPKEAELLPPAELAAKLRGLAGLKSIGTSFKKTGDELEMVLEGRKLPKLRNLLELGYGIGIRALNLLSSKEVQR